MAKARTAGGRRAKSPVKASKRITRRRKKEDLSYTNYEMMAICGARLILNNSVVLAGTGMPVLSAMLAQKLHAPEAKIVYEGGNIDTKNSVLPLSVSDPRLMHNAAAALDMRASLGELLQGGYIDVGFLGGAQIDRYGNINSTAIGKYKKPKVRLVGSGGANDIASMANSTFIITKHEPRKLHPCDYITSPGHLKGGNSRLKAGLLGEGPKYIITDLCIFDFHPKSKRARVKSIHPGVTRKDISHHTSWKPIMPWKIPTTKRPSNLELEVLRKKVDPKRIYLE